jgi:hypothetical protein
MPTRDEQPEHRCGVRGFVESGDKCPACHAPGGRHAVEEDIIEIDENGTVRALEGLIREVLQAEHEIRTIALVEWGWPSGPRHDALRRWAVALREAAAALQALEREMDGRVRGSMRR